MTNQNKMQVFESPAINYRHRAEFRMWHKVSARKSSSACSLPTLQCQPSDHDRYLGRCTVINKGSTRTSHVFQFKGWFGLHFPHGSAPFLIKPPSLGPFSLLFS